MIDTAVQGYHSINLIYGTGADVEFSVLRFFVLNAAGRNLPSVFSQSFNACLTSSCRAKEIYASIWSFGMGGHLSATSCTTAEGML